MAAIADENKRLVAENMRLSEAVRALEERLEGEHEDVGRMRRHMEWIGADKQALSERVASVEIDLAEVQIKLSQAIDERNGDCQAPPLYLQSSESSRLKV